MDADILKELELFKEHAMASPTVENSELAASSNIANDNNKLLQSAMAPKIDAASYKNMTGSSQYRFGVLTKIVKHMRNRHQDGDDHPLTLDEILDETNQLDIGSSVKNWLGTEALQNNPKIEPTSDLQRFSFKPVYKINDGKSLIRLLKQQDLKGLGGVMFDDIQESLPHCEKVLKNRASEIIIVVRPLDKKKILFYNDQTSSLVVDEEFHKLWRSTSVDAMDDAKIEEYLEKQGIRSMQDHGPKVQLPKRKKIITRKRQFKKRRDNEHIADLLETYDDNSLGISGGSST